MRTLFALLLLFTSAALAQGPANPQGNRLSRGNFLRIPAYQTAGSATTTNYFVDGSLGNDNNNCSASGASACLTIQGALNKIPKLLLNAVKVNVAAGTYAGFIVSGFYEDNGLQQTTGAIFISGGLSNSTLATGSATGTATSGTAGSGTTFGTLTDTGATWTVNDLVGRLITTATPTNTALVIASNTATTLTIVGTWSSPNASTTYAIQDPNVIVNTSLQRPGNAAFGPSNNRAAIQFLGNQILYRASSIVVQQMRLAPAAGGGVDIADNSSIQFQQMQIRTSNVPLRVSLGNANVDIINSDLDSTAGAAGIFCGAGAIQVGQGTGTGVLVRSGANGGLPGIQIQPQVAEPMLSGITQVQITGFTHGIQLTNSATLSTVNVLQVQIICFDSTGVGVQVGNTVTNNLGSNSGGLMMSTVNVATCGTGVQIVGPASADIVALTGAAATTGIAAILGGVAVFTKASTTITAGTNEINLDLGAVTASFADVTASHCISTIDQASRVCGR